MKVTSNDFVKQRPMFNLPSTTTPAEGLRFGGSLDINIQLNIGLIALLDPNLFKSCGYGPLTNLNTKQTLMF